MLFINSSHHTLGCFIFFFSLSLTQLKLGLKERPLWFNHHLFAWPTSEPERTSPIHQENKCWGILGVQVWCVFFLFQHHPPPMMKQSRCQCGADNVLDGLSSSWQLIKLQLSPREGAKGSRCRRDSLVRPSALLLKEQPEKGENWGKREKWQLSPGLLRVRTCPTALAEELVWRKQSTSEVRP